MSSERLGGSVNGACLPVGFVARKGTQRNKMGKTYREVVGLGGLGVTCSPRDQKITTCIVLAKIFSWFNKNLQQN